MKPSRKLVIALAYLAIAASAPAYAADVIDADTAIREDSSVDPSNAGSNNAELQALIGLANQKTGTQPQMQAEQQGPAAMWMLGVGNKTCKQWTDAKAGSLSWQGDEWAQGYWTGLNTLSEMNHEVGKSLSPKQILSEIRAKCVGNDDKTLQLAVSETYVDALKAAQ